MYIKMKQSQLYGAPTIRSITSSGFTIVAGAQDDISGIAKYEVYINGVKKKESTSGTISITGLSTKTSYDNIIVKVWNNAGLWAETVPTSVTTKNICYTSYCSGGSSINCSNCTGTGKITGKCVITKEVISISGGGAKSCVRHGEKHSHANWNKLKFTCSNCGKTSQSGTYCNSGSWGLTNIKEPSWDCTGQINCTTCNGSGIIRRTCSHGKTGSHRYCSHYSSTSLTSHDY